VLVDVPSSEVLANSVQKIWGKILGMGMVFSIDRHIAVPVS
jgi:hypothetical protein